MTTQKSKSPEDIAEDICRKWKTFWMNQKQNSEADYKNYLHRAMGIDANMRCHLEDLISQAIKAERDKIESSYCSVCGACGEDGCCSPDCCKYKKHYDTSYEELLNENERLRAERESNRLNSNK